MLKFCPFDWIFWKILFNLSNPGTFFLQIFVKNLKKKTNQFQKFYAKTYMQKFIFSSIATIFG